MTRAAKTPDHPQDFALRVVAWQRLQGRHGLPWQGTRDPYRIWLSEIMLQQTQVSTVLRYYGRFLERFPTVTHLALAGLDDVLALWSGLGYYSRARNLHACAQAVVQQHAGVFPTEAAVLETLPGIGRSTAAAVAAFSTGQRVAILDGNVKRVLARHRAFEHDVAKPAALRALWTVAEALLPPQGGMEAYTQGLMDLGATVCTRRRPRCEDCPVQADCRAHALGNPQAYPVKTRRTQRRARSSVLLLALHAPDGAPAAHLRRAGPEVQVLLQMRPPRGIWGGLWTLPLFDDERALDQALAARGLLKPLRVQALPPVQHALTHLDWTLKPCRVWVTPSEQGALSEGAGQPDAPQPEAGGWRWMGLDTALASGLPAPIRVLLEAEARQAGPSP